MKTYTLKKTIEGEKTILSLYYGTALVAQDTYKRDDGVNWTYNYEGNYNPYSLHGFFVKAFDIQGLLNNAENQEYIDQFLVDMTAGIAERREQAIETAKATAAQPLQDLYAGFNTRMGEAPTAA